MNRIPEGYRLLQLPASGYLQANGPFFARWDGERFVLGFRVAQRHCNSSGVCHGGMVATLCDVLLTVGSNIQSQLSRFLPTISMTCDFLGPARDGAWIEGRLDVLRTTRNLLFAAGLLEVAGEGPIARTSGVMKMSGDSDARYAADRYFE
ncbi:MAG TPA: PaaI family thioesterase [Casimicrobiaceae bacterium]|nr:PaaI family thioesterase [Casimicrobiaceae bacterium]